MSFLSSIKSLFSMGGSRGDPSSNNGKIVIYDRSAGVPAAGYPSFISPANLNGFPSSILCNEGTDFELSPVSTMITGISDYRSYILQIQIASAIRNGYVPVVLSGKGKTGEAYEALSLFYYPEGINYISDSADSGYYSPFKNMDPDDVTGFFGDLMSRYFQQEVSILVKNYIYVCLRVSLMSSNALGELMTGRINHTILKRHIAELNVPENEKQELRDLADSSASVSASVLSMIHDYMNIMKHPCTSPVRNNDPGNTPRITINRPPANTGYSGRIVIQGGTYSQGNPDHYSSSVNDPGFDLTDIAKRKCLFINLSDYNIRSPDGSLNPKCFQCFLSNTLQFEKEIKPFALSGRLCFIVEELSSGILKWYKWLLDLPNSIVYFNYQDFYSKIADAAELRQELISMVERIFFFTITDAASAKWVSDFFGSRNVEKISSTDLPPNDFWDIIFRKRTYTHQEEEKYWFSQHEIRQLRNKGIVFSLRDRIFKPCYLERGETYLDRHYRKKVNFCTFTFK